MIGKIKGTLVELDGTVGYVDTGQGILYKVYLPPIVWSKGHMPCPVDVYTYLLVKEDELSLFGFATKEEHDTFCDLIAISGVGPRVAFRILSSIDAQRLMAAIQDNDLPTLTSVPGLGKKTAMKIILELSQKQKKEFNLSALEMSNDDKMIVDALVGLGFNQPKVRKVLPTISKDLVLEERIKEGIRLVSQV